MDRLQELTDILHKVLDILKGDIDLRDIKQKLIEDLRLFKAGYVIENYPVWLENITYQTKTLSPNQTNIYFERILDLIQSISYGVVEDFHIKTTSEILKDLRDKRTFCPICGFWTGQYQFHVSYEVLKNCFWDCYCCGCMFGYNDSPQYRKNWFNKGSNFEQVEDKPENWTFEGQINNIQYDWKKDLKTNKKGVFIGKSY